MRPFLRWPDFAEDPSRELRADAAADVLLPPSGDRPLEQAIDVRWLALALGLLVVCGLAFGGSGRRTARATVAPVTSDVRDARRLMARVLAAYARKELPRFPRESLEAWSKRIGADDALLLAAVQAFQIVRFGGRALDDERRASLERAAE